MSRVLLTGCAGFIGMHVTRKLLQQGYSVLGIDNLSTYYVQQLKEDRLLQLKHHQNFLFLQLDLTHPLALHEGLRTYDIDYVIHLAAQPGVRYSIDYPEQCLSNNIIGFGNVLEFCRQRQVKHLVYASSSSVYGMNSLTPYTTDQNVDHPISLYAASKKANELMAHSYSHLFNLPTTGLRYFTVYGPWGRPDMSPWLFSQAIIKGEPIRLFNFGDMSRDFTFINDIAEGTVAILRCVATPNAKFSHVNPTSDSSAAPYRIFNIGNQQPIRLLEFVKTLEHALGRSARIVLEPLQAGDVLNTSADTQNLYRTTGFQPSTTLLQGLQQWAEWFLSKGQHYYG